MPLAEIVAVPDAAFVVDVLVTWIGAAALARYVMVVGSAEPRSALEHRARFLVGLFAALLFVRGFSWLAPASTTLALLTFIPVTLLPLAMTLFAEGLLRRHVPRGMKRLAVTATAVAFGANLARLVGNSPRVLLVISFVILASLLVAMTALAVLLARRDRASLSRSENALVRACLVVTAIGLPLAATDFRFDIGFPMVRLGTLGALLFCYTLLRHPQENARLALWLADVVRLVGKAALAAALAAIALQTTDTAVLVPLFVLAVAMAFAFAMLDRLRDVASTTPHTQLLRWLARETPTSLQQFARELRHLALTADATLLDANDLTPYDHAALAAAFPAHVVVQSLARLRALREGTAVVARGADELTDLLERNGATHVGLIAAEPIHLLMASVPELPGVRDVELALAAVVRRGEHARTAEMHVVAG